MKGKEIIKEMLKKIRLRLIPIQSRSTNAFTVQAELQIFKGVPCSSWIIFHVKRNYSINLQNMAL